MVLFYIVNVLCLAFFVFVVLFYNVDVFVALAALLSMFMSRVLFLLRLVVAFSLSSHGLVLLIFPLCVFSALFRFLFCMCSLYVVTAPALFRFLVLSHLFSFSVSLRLLSSFPSFLSFLPLARYRLAPA